MGSIVPSLPFEGASQSVDSVNRNGNRRESAALDRSKREGAREEIEESNSVPRADETAVSHSNQPLSIPNRSVTFTRNDNDRLLIQVVDLDTGDVVRQIPPDEILKLAETLQDPTGNLVNTSA